MSKFCKAYSLARLRQYKSWTENTGNARKIRIVNNGHSSDVPRPLAEKDILFLHDSFIVTDGIFSEQNIIFDQVSQEWIEFCAEQLEFNMPNFIKL